MNSADFEKRKSKNKIQTFIDKKNSVHTALTIKVWILFWFGYLKKSKRLDFLRHSCATLLYDNGVSLKDIQEWLGHSNIATTANIYTHLNYKNKINSANAIMSLLPGENEKELAVAAN